MNVQMLREIGDFIFKEDAPVKSDVILLPGSTHWEHVETASLLYRQGMADYIVPCGMYSYRHGRFLNEKLRGTTYEGDYETEAACYRAILMQNGVPESAILCEDKSTNTFENAMFAYMLLRDQGIRCETALLCCQAFHARRAYMTFARYFPDTHIRVIPTVTQDISRENWYEDEKKFLCVMSEMEKCGRFFNDMYPFIKSMKG